MEENYMEKEIQLLKKLIEQLDDKNFLYKSPRQANALVLAIQNQEYSSACKSIQFSHKNILVNNFLCGFRSQVSVLKKRMSQFEDGV
jgi:DNA-directed RNA polymerase specialized sigma54-like protein